VTDHVPTPAAWAGLPALTADRVGTVRAVLGEGPTWDPVNQVVWWVDIQGRGLHRTALDGSDRRIAVARPLGCVVLRASGGLAGASPDGFVAIDPDDGALTLLAAVEADDPTTRMNDGKVDQAGRFWAGTMLDHEGPHGGALYRLDADLSVTRMLQPVSIANGLDWTDDGREMLYIDTSTLRIDRIEYDAATGDLGARRPWVIIPDGAGYPDGMTLDTEGCAWVALWGAGCVVRFSPDGVPMSRIDVPAASSSSCAFVGPDLDQLIITTAQWPDPATALPGAGGLYVARPGVRGRPATAFAG
jgi:sugar lactone lactonase YvrE